MEAIFIIIIIIKETHFKILPFLLSSSVGITLSNLF